MLTREVFSRINCDRIIRGSIYLMIFWLPYSSAVIEVSVVLALIVWLIKVCSRTSSEAVIIQRDPNRWVIASFLIICFLSLLENSMGLAAFGHYLTKTVEWFVIYYLVCDVFCEEKHFYFLLKVLLITSLATALDALFQYYISHRDIFMGHPIVPGESPTAGFKTPNGLGAFLAAVLPLSVFCTFGKKRRWSGIAGLFVVNIILFWALVITASRGAMIAVGITAFLSVSLLIFGKMLGGWRKKAAVLFTACCIVAILFTSFSNAFNMRKIVSADWRLQIWKESIELIKQQPLLGYGVNMYMPQYQILRKSITEDGSTKDGPTYAHNCFIQIFFETGLLGLAAFILIIGGILRSARVNFQRFCSADSKVAFLSLGSAASFVTMLIHSFFDNHLYSLQLSAFFWVVAGLIMAVNLNLLKKGEAQHA